MTARPQLRVLFFDVFGTCVAQRKPVADELWTAAKEALESDVLSISDQVRERAINMTYEKWFEFGGEWNKVAEVFVSESKSKYNNVDWKAVDRNRIDTLYKLLAEHGLVILNEDTSTSGSRVKEGSLWNESQLEHLGLVWHRLPPWPDTCPGMELLNQQFSTVALSNTYNGLLQSLVAHSSIPFKKVYSSDMFLSFKPNPDVYLGAAEKMGVKPEECGLVAAHLSDLKGAKACGLYAINVVRPLEEKNPELENENIPDLRIEESSEGFVNLAKRLSIT